MKKNVRPAAFITAAVLSLSAAIPAYASQLVPPGGANLNNTAPGINNAAPGYAAPGAQPGRVPGYTAPGAAPNNVYRGAVPGNTAPGATQGNMLPGAAPRVNAPGTQPFNAAPGVQPYNTAPGTQPFNTAPGTQPYRTAPGMQPYNAAPGAQPYNTAPGTQPFTAPGAQVNPGMQPGYAAPGIINPNSPYNSGTNIPGTSTVNPQVGGVTNDPAGGNAWQTTPAKQSNEPVLDPVTGRTRPLLKATPIPGEIDVYNVHLHDTLWIISQKYKIRLDAVIDANPELPDPDLIYPGDQIKVPLNPKEYDMMDISDPNVDKGDGSTKIRSNIVQGRYSGVTQQTQENSEEKELLDLVNSERAKAGLPPVKLSAAVGTAARIKADEMCAKQYFNHTSPTYGTPFEMLRAFGISYRTAGENIAKGQKTANAVMGAWMNSQGHRANILNRDFTEIGVGYAGDSQLTYWVIIFIGK